MNKLAVFKQELSYINDEKLRDFARMCLTLTPDYFFTMPASTTGKYHPDYSLGEGGLVRHTKAAVRFANDLLSLEQFSDYPHDEIIVALLLHDSIKKGKDGSAFTTNNHPKLAGDFIEETAKLTGYDGENAHYIAEMVRSHMGQWNDNGNLPKPLTKSEKFVHMCDYLASRKYLIVKDLQEEKDGGVSKDAFGIKFDV